MVRTMAPANACSHSQRRPTHKFCPDCGAISAASSTSPPAAAGSYSQPSPAQPPRPTPQKQQVDFSRPMPLASEVSRPDRPAPSIPYPAPSPSPSSSSSSSSSSAYRPTPAPPSPSEPTGYYRPRAATSSTPSPSPSTPPVAVVVDRPTPAPRTAVLVRPKASRTIPALAPSTAHSWPATSVSPPLAAAAGGGGVDNKPAPPQRRPSRPAMPSPTSAVLASYNPSSSSSSPASHSSLPAPVSYAPHRPAPMNGSVSAPVSMVYTTASGSPTGSGYSPTVNGQNTVSGPLPSARPEEMTKEERELKKLLREVEREKEKVLQEERVKERERHREREEEEYVKEKQREYIQKANAGMLEFGKRESVYVHQVKSAPVLRLELLDETASERHNAQTYTVYKIRISWADCVWTIQRRYSQFSDFHKSVKRKTNIKLPYSPPPKKIIGSSLEDEVIEQRKVGLRQYLLGVEEHQMEFVNNEKYEQVFIRFVGPFQLGDTKDHVPNKLPFKIVL